MLFNSFRFLFLFLPVVAAGYYICAHRISGRAGQIVLILSSLFFYGSARVAYVPLLACSILFNFFLARVIASAEGPWRKRLLVSALAANIALLASFKYINFALRSLSAFTRMQFSLPDWEFPLGISFFTLQQVMYLVDCYEKLVPANDLWTHAAFASFFPCVISGPITRARQMVPQLSQAVTTNAAKISQALSLLAMGLFKKVALADSFSRIADAGFSHPAGLSALEAWSSSFAYTFQLYFDFSGYSDMAIATALLLGFSLPVNFDTPYRSLSITEFWQRWHITLSQFITTYLYTPIVKSFKKATMAKASMATLLAMTIAGLWHGPSWTFVLFGALHGFALVVNQYWRKKVKRHVPRPLAWAATMLFVNFAFIFFRASNIASALEICRDLWPNSHPWTLLVLKESIRMSEAAVIAIPLFIGLAAAFLGDNSNVISRRIQPRFSSAWAVAGLILVSLLFMNSNLAKEFIYFAF